jgi:hypothetical protein
MTVFRLMHIISVLQIGWYHANSISQIVERDVLMPSHALVWRVYHLWLSRVASQLFSMHILKLLNSGSSKKQWITADFKLGWTGYHRRMLMPWLMWKIFQSTVLVTSHFRVCFAYINNIVHLMHACIQSNSVLFDPCEKLNDASTQSCRSKSFPGSSHSALSRVVFSVIVSLSDESEDSEHDWITNFWFCSILLSISVDLAHLDLFRSFFCQSTQSHCPQLRHFWCIVCYLVDESITWRYLIRFVFSIIDNICVNVVHDLSSCKMIE